AGRVGDGVGDVHDLAGLDDVGELAAAAGHEDVGGVTGVEGGLELAVHVLVLDGLDRDLHAGVGLLEVGDGRLPVGLALAGRGVVPERHADVAVGVGPGVGVAAAGGERQGECRGRGRDRGELACTRQSSPSSSGLVVGSPNVGRVCTAHADARV